MPVTINVTAIQSESDYKFRVQVKENRSQTEHIVSMDQEFYKNLETTKDPKEVIRKSFEFLLQRESKESILSEFNLKQISNYFPEYRERLQRELKG